MVFWCRRCSRSAAAPRWARWRGSPTGCRTTQRSSLAPSTGDRLYLYSTELYSIVQCSTYTGISKCHPSVQGAGHPPGPRRQADARQGQRSQEDSHLPPRHGQADMTWRDIRRDMKLLYDDRMRHGEAAAALNCDIKMWSSAWKLNLNVLRKLWYW